MARLAVDASGRHEQTCPCPEARRPGWRAAAGIAIAGSVVAGLAACDLVPGADAPAEKAGTEPNAVSRATAAPVPAGSSVSPFRWARSLPQGPPPRVPFVTERSVLIAGERVPVPGDRDIFRLIGRVVGGWLVLVDLGLSPDPLRGEYGILRRSGRFEALPFPPDGWQTDTAAVAPDRSVVMYDGLVVDSDTRRVVHRLPRAYWTYGWSVAGLVFAEYESPRRNEHPLLWAPGQKAVRLDEPIFAVAESARRGISFHSGCSYVSDITTTGSTSPVLEWCRADRLLSLSPDGSLAVARSGLVVDVRTKQPLRHASVPPDVTRSWRPVFEGNRRILFTLVFGTRWRGETIHQRVRPAPIIVRCGVSTGQCERAGDPVPAADESLLLGF